MSSSLRSGRLFRELIAYPLRRKSLSFRHRPVGDEGAAQIADALCSVRLNLSELDLSYTNIGDAGAKALGIALQHTRAPLEKLLLHGNTIGDDGFVALADGVTTNTTVTELGLRNNEGITNTFMCNHIQQMLHDRSRKPVQSPPDCLSPMLDRKIAPTIGKRPLHWLTPILPTKPTSMHHGPLTTKGIVFLSHTGKDILARHFSAHLWEALAHHFDVFYDDYSLEPGAYWKAKIEESARSCDVFLCLYSESYWKRYWCMFELNIAIQTGKTILPVFFDGAMPPEASDEEFHSIFRDFHRLTRNRRSDQPCCDNQVDVWFSNLNSLHCIGSLRANLSSLDRPKRAELDLKHSILHHTHRLVRQGQCLTA